MKKIGRILMIGILIIAYVPFVIISLIVDLIQKFGWKKRYS
jgi:hypothetical protein